MPPSRKRSSAHPALRPFHPLVREWFADTLGTPSAPQVGAWPAIASGDDTLVLAPTGTGKTLAAFLWELNALITDGLERPLANAVHLLYVSPLKALNNDVRLNLERPLAALRALAADRALPFPEIRVAVRTGDTPQKERRRMLTKAPHVLITTPESLHILLTSQGSRGMFSSLRAVVIDEIHAVAGTKRGAHLALTLERLDEAAGHRAQRIGLSATQRPLEEIARFLSGVREGSEGAANGERRPADGNDLGTPRPPSAVRRSPEQPSTATRIVDCGMVKSFDLRTTSAPDGGGWGGVLPIVLEAVRGARTTLVFVNNRGQAERLAAKLNAMAGEALALPYHGSLSRERRLTIEGALKAGELRAVFTTSSLELGIDVGSVDLVVQLQSPKRVSAGLQRVGRAGHALGAVSRGLFVALTPDDGIETLALVSAMREGDVEPTRVVRNPLDVLAQVIVAAVSVEDREADELFATVRRAYPFSDLGRGAFDEVLAMLSGKYPSDLAAALEARITWDRVTGRLAGSKGSRMSAIMSGGTIPDRGLYAVHLGDNTRLGELDEEFVHESRVGDAFQLGSSTWRIAAIEHDRVVVNPAPGAPARMPFWHGEYAARDARVAPRVGAVRRALVEVASEAQADAVAERFGTDRHTVLWLADYVRREREATGHLPDERTLLVEEFRDETGSVRLVFHAPFGARVNAPWGMALAQRARESLGALGGKRDGEGGTDVQVQTTDDGIMLRLPDLGAVTPVRALLDIAPAEAERRVLEEVGGASLFGARFRMNAARALLLPRGSPRRRMPLWLQRLKALDLLQVVRDFPSFPILVETYRDVLSDAFDLASLGEVLGRVARGEVKVETVKLDRPSPFAAALQFGFVMGWLYGDDTPRAEQRAGLLSLDRALLDELMGTSGADEGTMAALEEVLSRRRGTMPGRRARTADELATLVDRAGDLTVDELRLRIATAEDGARGDPTGDLLASGRAVALPVPTSAGAEWRVTLTELVPRYLAAFGDDAFATVRRGSLLEEVPFAEGVPEAFREAVLTRGAARRELFARWSALAGPFTLEEAQRRYLFPARWIEGRCAELVRSGTLVRGIFGGDRETQRWCARRPLESARRKELAALRRAIAPVELDRFAAFLARWQRVEPGERLDATEGILALEQLVGLPAPASSWTRDFLAARVERYAPDDLDRFASRAELLWVAVPRKKDEPGTLGHVRWLPYGAVHPWREAPGAMVLSPGAERVRALLREHGASRASDLHAVGGMGIDAIKDALRELASAGLATNDSADALRDVARWSGRPRPGAVEVEGGEGGGGDRWLPAGFTPSAGRPARRPNRGRLPRWTRPDLPGGRDGWSGRWSLVDLPLVLGGEEPIEAQAMAVARQWLDRYGVVTRECWKRERPAVGWRAIYVELRRLELRGEVRRGYFVRGLSGAQFAHPDAVELLREPPREDAPLVVLAANDPAHPWALPIDAIPRDALHRPRSPGAALVLRDGRVVLSSSRYGRTLTVAADVDGTLLARALAEWARWSASRPKRERGSGARSQRDVVVETVNDEPAARSRFTDALHAAGFRMSGARGMVFEAEL